jgi:DNA-binding CsgD family transcriptional regulator/tetratricopeptide (TPR) repeat protein
MKLRVQTLDSDFASVQLEDGRSFEVPRLWLPALVHEGDVLRAFGDGDTGLRLQPEAGLGFQRHFRALPSAALDALQQLAVIPGAFTSEFAEAVLEVPDFALTDGFEGFIGRNFLRVVSHDPSLYALDRGLRSHVLRLPLGAAALEGARRRHASYVLSLASQWRAAHGTPEETRVLDQFEAKLEDFRAALEWTLPHSDANVIELGARLAAALETFWWRRGHFMEGRRWLEAAVGRAPQLPPELAAQVRYCAGIFAQSQGDYAVAFNHFEAALEIFERFGYLSDAARVMGEYGFALMRTGQFEAARTWLERDLEAALVLEDRSLEATSLNTLAMVALRTGNNAEAEALLQGSLALKAQLGDRTGRARSLTNLAMVRIKTGRLEEAQTMLLEALDLRRELGDRNGSAVTLHALGVVALAHDEVNRAAVLLLEALQLAVELGDAVQTADDLEALAQVALGKALFSVAAQLHGSAQALRIATQSPRPPAFDRDYEVQVIAKLSANLEPALLEQLIRQGTLLGAGKTLELAQRLLETPPPSEVSAVSSEVDSGVDSGVDAALLTVSEMPVLSLSPREREVLSLLAHGESNKRIAKRLAISEHTVKSHVTGLFNKLGVNSRARAVAVAAELNLL